MPEPGWLGGAYLWVKALHLIMVLFWMAGMFMAPRFFAYHSECAPGSPEDMAWQERERRLIRIIINPSMILAWVFGLMLVFHLGWDAGLWLWLKLALVTGLAALHGFIVRWWKAFGRGENRHSTRFFRLMNEIPTLAAIPIIILVIVKPF
jgi:protoporphyrinogen IX oxidase